MPGSLTPFHLAIAVHNITAARAFYGGVLGCPEGRSGERWVDFNLFGHQLVCHQVDTRMDLGVPTATNGDNIAGDNLVDGHDVPVPHFGVVLGLRDWHALADRLRAAGTRFVIEPHVRFAGQPGEQATLFLLDPSGNALEFKAFADIDAQLFAT